MINFTGQTALVTGGSRGIGAATAKMFAEAGADVAITYLNNKKAADGVLKKIVALGKRGVAVKGDLVNSKSAKRIVGKVIAAFGRIDILINNAGIWNEGSINKMSEKAWDDMMEINLKSVFNMCRYVIPVMKKQRHGKIINISSTAGQRGEAYHSHYATTKGGIIAFTKSIAPELINDGIRVNCVAPGWVVTDMTIPYLKDKKQLKEVKNTIPRGKIATPEEIAGPILFLASSLADNIVGEILNVNGGSVLCG